MRELKLEIIDKVKSGQLAPDFETLKPLIHAEGVINGTMVLDPQKCTGCGLCIQNCPFKCWEMGEDKHARLKKSYVCFSCFNCMIACPKDAISIGQTFDVKDGFFDTAFPGIKTPLQPRDTDGRDTSWNDIEKLILNRRSVRNFKKDPVPEPIIRRILEAGRFAPSGGNNQPWQFTVVTDPELLGELEVASQGLWAGLDGLMADDSKVADLVKTLPVAIFDPRVRNGMGCIARKELPVFMNAPLLIFVAGNGKMGDPELHAGIAAQNMNLVAKSLGLGCCYAGFGRSVNLIPGMLERLGYSENWTVHTVLCIGYPRFKQEGIVPRHYRPVTWFRPGSKGPQIEK
jgi:nitroreductase/NAD-dependent dihydropyrimidine dehydrogenase PreA subunit